jgi:hypothetical protein
MNKNNLQDQLERMKRQYAADQGGGGEGIKSTSTSSASAVAASPAKKKDSNNASKRSKKKRSMKAVAKKSAPSRPQAMSKYTGLPKGPGGIQAQEAIVQAWLKNGHKWPSDKKMASLIQNVKVVPPSSVRKLNRLDAMAVCARDFGIRINRQGITALANSKEPFRGFYEVLCSLYGMECRKNQATRSEFGAYTELVGAGDGDSDEVKEMKKLMKWAVTRRADLQRKWQGLMNVFREAHADLIADMRRTDSDLANLNAHLTGTHFSEGDLQEADASFYGGMSGGGGSVPTSNVEPSDESESSEDEDDDSDGEYEKDKELSF